jgi:hypothetical protein
MENQLPLPGFVTPPIHDPVTQLLIQPSVYKPEEAPFLPPEQRPQLDYDFIKKVVGGRTWFKASKVAGHARAEWDRHLGGKILEARARRKVANAAIPGLKLRARYHTVVAHLCGTFEQFRAWTSWAAFKFRLFQAAAWTLVVASVTGTFKLLSLQAPFADSPVSCAVIAAVVAVTVYGVKGMIGKIESATLRRRLRIGLDALSLVLLVTYCVLLAFQTGGLAAGVQDVLRIGQGSASFGLPWLSPYLQACQLLVEVFAALSCFENGEAIAERYGDPNRTLSAAKELRLQQAHALDVSLKSLHESIAQGEKEILRLKADRKSYVLSAVMNFEREAELDRRQSDGLRRARTEAEPRRSFLRRCADIFRR